MNLYQAQRSNRIKTIGIVVLFILFFGLMGFGFDYFYSGFGTPQSYDQATGEVSPPAFFVPIATIAALFFAGLFSTLSYFTGDKMVLASCQARRISQPAGPQERQLVNIVEEIAIAAGIPVPAVYVVGDLDPNAFATGRNPRHASIAVTQGLLNTLNREELQGVIAHELSHVRNSDILCMTLIAALVGAIGLLADWAMRASYYSGPRIRESSSRERGGGGGAIVVFLVWIIAAILAPILGRILAMAVSRQREYLADASGAELTRNPLGLASALRKVESAAAPTRAIKRGMAHLCIADPLGMQLGNKEGFVADLFATHPPMAKRIARLEAMAYASRP